MMMTCSVNHLIWHFEGLSSAFSRIQGWFLWNRFTCSNKNLIRMRDWDENYNSRHIKLDIFQNGNTYLLTQRLARTSAWLSLTTSPSALSPSPSRHLVPVVIEITCRSSDSENSSTPLWRRVVVRTSICWFTSWRPFVLLVALRCSAREKNVFLKC